MGWTVRGSNTGGARFSALVYTGPGPPSLLYNEYMVILLGKVAGVWRLYLRGRLKGDLYLYLEYKMKLFH
jgi:hypothetical protein